MSVYCFKIRDDIDKKNNIFIIIIYCIGSIVGTFLLISFGSIFDILDILGGGGAGPERGGDGLGGGVGLGSGIGLGGGVGLGGGGGRAVTIKDSIKDLSKLFFLLGDGGGYLSKVEVHGEDERGELGGGGG